MNDLISDYCKIVDYDDELKNLLSHIDLSEITWSDDDGNSNEDYKKNNTFSKHILTTAQTIISEKYLCKYYDVIPCESKVICGITDKVLEWHNDRVACMEEINKKIVPDHNLLCLFYFNTLNEGGVSIWNKFSDPKQQKIVTVMPKIGQLIFLNETNPNIVHRVHAYDKSIVRYIARFSYNIKGIK
jgi:hypothetical protein